MFFCRNGDNDVGRSRLMLNGMNNPLVSEKLAEEFNASYWGPRETEVQTRQNYARNRYNDQNSRSPYPTIYGRHAFSKCMTFIFFLSSICVLE